MTGAGDDSRHISMRLTNIHVLGTRVQPGLEARAISAKVTTVREPNEGFLCLGLYPKPRMGPTVYTPACSCEYSGQSG